MQKNKKENKGALPVARAVGNKIKASQQKLGLIADLIRGQPVDRALRLLKFCCKRAAPVVLKVLQSAVANAEIRLADIDRLVVANVWVGKSHILKRWYPRARGRGARIFKHYSNIVIVVQEKD